MATEKQLLANRRNAAKSTGPRTVAGKARSRINATRHGLTCAAARAFAITAHGVGDLSDRLARIDAETARLSVEIEQALALGETGRITRALRRLYALHRYADRCYSRLRKKEEETSLGLDPKN